MSSRTTQYRRDIEERNEMFRALGITGHRRSRSPIMNQHEENPIPNGEDLDNPVIDIDVNDNDNGQDDVDDNNDNTVEDDDDFENDCNTDDPMNNDVPVNDPADIGRKLVSWHLEYNISERATNDLLNWLKEHYFPQLPMTIKSLKTAAKIFNSTIERMEPGKFCYFGLKRMLTHILTRNADQPLQSNCGSLQFGIDGVPLAKSSGNSFWPILVKLKEYPDVLPVAVYEGAGKPPDVHIYMQEFMTELDDVLKNGMDWNNLTIRMKVSAFIMDAPAKSYVLDIKGHTGFYACPKCITRGINVQHRTTFPDINEELRTDESFLDLTDQHHLRADQHCPLVSIGVGCVTQIPIDYMHNVLLGVFRSLVKRWCAGSGPYYLNEAKKNAIDKRIKTVAKQKCLDFAREPRSLTYIKLFKATEWRLLLLYLGPFIFVDVLKPECYQHFLKLHCGVRILCHPVLYRTMNELAKNLIMAFAVDFMNLYGRQYFVFNYHVLTHLADECMLHGPLDDFSAFPFENFLQVVLHYRKPGSRQLEQFQNRLNEHLTYNQPCRTPIIRERANSYSRISNNKNISITVEGNDRFVCQDNSIYIVREILKQNNRFILHCNKIINLAAMYLDPMDSKSLGVYCSGNFSFDQERTELEADAVMKVQHLNLGSLFGFVVILHSSNCCKYFLFEIQYALNNLFFFYFSFFY